LIVAVSGAEQLGGRVLPADLIAGHPERATTLFYALPKIAPYQGEDACDLQRRIAWWKC